MGIPILRGRDFDEHDGGEFVARRHHQRSPSSASSFPTKDPIGHKFKDDYDGFWRTIVAWWVQSSTNSR